MTDTDPLIENELCSTETENHSTKSNGNSGDALSIYHPDHIIQKCIALLLMCFLGFGSYFCYDSPGALQDYFIKDMSLSTSQFVLLYSWYAWPNVILCSVGGYLMDRVFGVRLGTIIYALLVVIGQIVFAFGAYINLFFITIVGRFIFGVGGESLSVAQNSYAVLWFKGKELNMVFGFQLSFARVGSTVNFILMEPLYQYISHYYTGYQCLGIALFIASISCVLSFISSLILAKQDKHAENLLRRRQNQTTDVVKISDVKHFPVTFWFITFTIVFYYGVILPFVALGKVFFERKYDLSAEMANLVNSILFIIAAFLSPFLGFVVDRFGKNLSFVFGALLITIAGHMMLAFTLIYPLISMCVVGVGYSVIASALWPLIALVTPQHLLGTAYGIAQSLQNLGLGIIAVIAGLIVDNYGYFLLEIYFISCLCVSLLMLIIMWIYDIRRTGYLNMSTSERILFDNSKTITDENDKLLCTNGGSGSEEHCDNRSVSDHSDYGSVVEDDINFSSESAGVFTPVSGPSLIGQQNLERKPQFGNRFLEEGDDVYRYNAWDNVKWDEEQKKSALEVISSQLKTRMSENGSKEFIKNASHYWNEFYNIHGDKFYKDRHWLFTEFPELSSVIRNTSATDDEKTTQNSLKCVGSSKVIFEVGCGVGNAVFPILQYSNDHDVRIYCCDFSENAIKIIKDNPFCDARCIAFVCDITEDNWTAPFNANSVDIILLIYVLSSVRPSKMKYVLKKLYDYLKPGGLILFRDYGKYDLSQLRFKEGRCVSENCYVRGEGTLVYFFDINEICKMFRECGYEILQNIYDKRLQVNRKKKLKMYRVWVQGKFMKPLINRNEIY